MILFVVITLILPSIIGFMYHIFPEMTSITQIQTLENIKIEGYIYRNMITNVLLLIPFCVYYFYQKQKEKKIEFVQLFTIVLVMYLLAIGIAMLRGVISTYYFYKIHFVLWLVMWVLSYKGAVLLISNKKMGDMIVKTYTICYVGLFVVSFLTSHVPINKDYNTHEKLTDVMDIYGINKTFLFRVEEDFNQAELELLKAIKTNNIPLHNNNTLLLAEQRQEYWFWAIEDYKFKESLNYPTTAKHIMFWNNGNYEYLIYFNRSHYYQDYKHAIDLKRKRSYFCERKWSNYKE